MPCQMQCGTLRMRVLTWRVEAVQYRHELAGQWLHHNILQQRSIQHAINIHLRNKHML